MDRLADWTAAVSAALDIGAGQVDTESVLELAREVVGRQAAVVAAYLLGVAVGQGADPTQAAARLADLTRRWSGTTFDWRD